MKPRSPFLLDRTQSALLVIDVQERLLPSIPDRTSLIWNIGRLIDAAKLFDVRVLITEQYPRGLGHTTPELAARLETPAEKNMFSCRQCTSLFDQLVADQIRQVVLVGIEAHVCVQQTALDLISMGFDVFVVADAVGSRKPMDQDVAFQRMQSCGAMLTTSEAVMFEWCETSQDPQFKALSRLVLPTTPNPPNETKVAIAEGT